MATNYVSLKGAVNKNGQPIDFLTSPLKEDITTENIVWVRLSQAANSSGTLIPAFEVMVEDKASLTAIAVYLYTYTGFSTITDFNGGLIYNATETPFTRYVNLLTIDFATVIDPTGTTNKAQGVLINDRYVSGVGRRYQTSSNSTFVNVKFANRLVPTVFEFSGNQTIAGTGAYFYTAS